MNEIKLYVLSKLMGVGKAWLRDKLRELAADKLDGILGALDAYQGTVDSAANTARVSIQKMLDAPDVPPEPPEEE